MPDITDLEDRINVVYFISRLSDFDLQTKIGPQRIDFIK